MRQDLLGESAHNFRYNGHGGTKLTERGMNNREAGTIETLTRQNKCHTVLEGIIMHTLNAWNGFCGGFVKNTGEPHKEKLYVQRLYI